MRARTHSPLAPTLRQGLLPVAEEGKPKGKIMQSL
jgi:hypothetical protein